jgi:hypothetical protein
MSRHESADRSQDAPTNDEDLRAVVAEVVAEQTEDLREELAEERAKRHEAEDRIKQLELQNEDLRAEVEDLRSSAARFADERDELRERVAELEDESDKEFDRLAYEQSKIRRKLHSVKETVEATEAVTSESEDYDEDLTPMEQIARMPEHVATEQFDNPNHRNTYRARALVRDFSDYARKTPRGHVLKNPDLCRVLRAQEDGNIESKTGERVMKRIEDLSDGLFEHVAPSENRHGEHILVLSDAQDLSLGSGAVVS